MKIGFVLDDSLDKTDGVQQYILTLGHWLTKDGHEVHYLVGETKRNDIAHIHSLSRNIQVHFNQNRMSTPLPASRKKLKRLLEVESFDVLHVQLPFSPFLAGRLIRNAPSQTTIVGTFHIIPFSRLERMASRLLRIWTRKALKRFTWICSVSEPAKIFAKKIFKLETTVLPNVVDLAAFKSTKQLSKYHKDMVNIVYIGRLVERKGALELLKAIRLLKDKKNLEDVRVIICGKGPLGTSLQNYIAKHHLKHLVHQEGFISEKDKPGYLGLADIAVFPSTGGESFGIVLIEAMAAGSGVVIAGDNDGYRAVMDKHTDQLISPRNTELFAKTLKHFIINSQARHKAQIWQNEHVKQFDVRYVGPRLLAEYKTAIAKNKQYSNN